MLVRHVRTWPGWNCLPRRAETGGAAHSHAHSRTHAHAHVAYAPGIRACAPTARGAAGAPSCGHKMQRSSSPPLVRAHLEWLAFHDDKCPLHQVTKVPPPKHTPLELKLAFLSIVNSSTTLYAFLRT